MYWHHWHDISWVSRASLLFASTSAVRSSSNSFKRSFALSLSSGDSSGSSVAPSHWNDVWFWACSIGLIMVDHILSSTVNDSKWMLLANRLDTEWYSIYIFILRFSSLSCLPIRLWQAARRQNVRLNHPGFAFASSGRQPRFRIVVVWYGPNLTKLNNIIITTTTNLYAALCN